MRSSGPAIDPSLAMVYRQAREAAGSPVSETDSWTLELLVGVDSGLAVLDGVEPGRDLRQLADLVADRAVRRHFASCHSVGGDTVRVLPAWLLEDGRGLRERNICIVSGAFAETLHIADALTTKPLSPKRLRNFALRRRRPSGRRRQRLAEEAQLLLDCLRQVLGALPENARVLGRVAEHPAEAEREALTAWNGFIDECCNRMGRQAVKAGMTLEGLALLSQGRGGGRDRVWFMEQYPWAFGAALDSGEAERLFRRIDENRANARAVAERLLCCQRLEECESARLVAKRMPKYRADPALLRVLGRYSSERDTRFRALLLEANARDGGELLEQVLRDGAATRRRLAFATQAILRTGVTGSGLTTRYGCGMLAFRSFAWSRQEPEAADPAVLVEGLAAASADCLAGFAAGCPPDETDDPDHPEGPDPVDRGILALTGLLEGSGRPELTGTQLVAFAEGAAARCVHRIRILERADVGSKWPEPPGWNAQSRVAGARFLATPGAVRAEGRQMQNCLHYAESYIHGSALGRLALFSIRAPGGDGPRATLSLASLASLDDGRIRVDGYRVSEFRGFGNGEPDPACLVVAERVARALNGGCPFILPREEARRRAQVRRTLNERRSYNEDAGAAEERWRELYLPLLPRRFADLSPRTVVEEWFRKRAGGA